jgi:prepilin-type N-terminal cleavage/methylation domain-containing protein
MMNVKTGKQKGYTVIEMVIGLALVGILGFGVTGFTMHTLSYGAESNNKMQALMQVENAGYWMSRDVQMSANISLGENAGFPLELTWLDIDQNDYQVLYSLTGSEIQRTLAKNGQEDLQTTIAQSINPAIDLTSCTYIDGLFIFKVTATLGSNDVTRTYQIKKRLDFE